MSNKKALIASLLVVASIGMVGCGSNYGSFEYGDEVGQGYESEADLYAVAPEAGTNNSECVYDPTYNNDWHDDMLCGDVRPYLLPNDEYITRDEIEAAARRWVLGQDEDYKEYRREYRDYLKRMRKHDKEYLSQFDEYGNCMNPNGCAMERP